jgi:uncharacterized protein YkwD
MQLPALHGNWIDFIIISYLLFYIWEGWGRGFIVLFLDLVAFAVSFLIALKTYAWLGKILVDNFAFTRGLAYAISFAILWVTIEQILIHVLDLVREKIPNKWQGHPLNKYLAVFPLFANAIIIIAFISTIIIGLPLRPEIKTAISQSRIAGYLIDRTTSVEKALAGVFGEAISDTFNFTTISPLSKEQVKLNFTQRELRVDVGSEEEMLIRVNKERRDRGIVELTIDPALRDLARKYARDMFERGYFSHYNPEGMSPFDRMEQAGIHFIAAGENLALAPNVTIAHQGLMDSPGHRANILSTDFGKVGIGVMDGGMFGRMFVQEFTD